jgi:NAD(P)-dependent dehydrogenase (short-subunit alcohol dehydrogenase family)
VGVQGCASAGIAGCRAFKGVLPYCVAKGALDQLTRCMAFDLAPHKVRVTSVAPATVETTFHDRAGMGLEGAKRYYEESAAVHPLGRTGEPKEIAEAIVGLTKQRWTTGSILYVDGGRLLTTATGASLSGAPKA